MIPLTEKDIKEYLDSCIKFWRGVKNTQDCNPEDTLRAIYYIDAFQSVRISLFDELLW